MRSNGYVGPVLAAWIALSLPCASRAARAPQAVTGPVTDRFDDFLDGVDPNEPESAVLAARKYRELFVAASSSDRAIGLSAWMRFVEAHARDWCDARKDDASLLTAQRARVDLTGQMAMMVAADNSARWFGYEDSDLYEGRPLTLRTDRQSAVMKLKPSFAYGYIWGDREQRRRIPWLATWRSWNSEWDRAEKVAMSSPWVESILVFREPDKYGSTGRSVADAVVAGSVVQLEYNSLTTEFTAHWGNKLLVRRRFPELHPCSPREFELMDAKGSEAVRCSVSGVSLATVRMSRGAFHITLTPGIEYADWYHFVVPFRPPASMPRPFVYCTENSGFILQINEWMIKQLGSPSRLVQLRARLVNDKLKPVNFDTTTPSSLVGIERAIGARDRLRVLAGLRQAGETSTRLRDRQLDWWIRLFSDSDDEAEVPDGKP